MKPALIATEALSKESINIIEGEFIVESLLGQTVKLDTRIGKKFHKALIDKLEQRRNTVVTSLALYLLNKDLLSKTKVAAYPLSLASKTNVQQLGTKLIKQLFEPEGIDSTAAVENDGGSRDDTSANLSFKDELKRAVGSGWGKASQTKPAEEDSNTAQKHFRQYDQHRQKSPSLEKLFLACCSIPPTSTRSEQNFSLSGNIITKQRTRLTPEHVDILCFLKSYFLSKRQTPS